MVGEFIVFSREGCTFCDKAKTLLTKKGLEYKVISLEGNHLGNKVAFRSAIEKRIPEGIEFSTLPQIFVGDRHIGGYTELVRIVGD